MTIIPTLAATIVPRLQRTLELGPIAGDGVGQVLAAGSGLVVVGDFLYVVADDELHLGCFRRSTQAPGNAVRLFCGELPREPRARKAAKPDLEALVLLPPFDGAPQGALLAVPSGSKPSRHWGAVLALDADGAVSGIAQRVDFSGLYAALAGQIAELNIEGAVVVDDALLLLQRASRAQPLNALITLSLPDVLAAVGVGAAIPALAPQCVRWIDLGRIDGVPVSLTDGAVLPDGRLVVSAVAERTANSYADGPCLGAVIAVIEPDGRVSQKHLLQPTLKVEGIQAWLDKDRVRLWLVTDADDASVASCLVEAELPFNK